MSKGKTQSEIAAATAAAMGCCAMAAVHWWAAAACRGWWLWMSHAEAPINLLAAPVWSPLRQEAWTLRPRPSAWRGLTRLRLAPAAPARASDHGRGSYRSAGGHAVAQIVMPAPNAGAAATSATAGTSGAANGAWTQMDALFTLWRSLLRY